MLPFSWSSMFRSQQLISDMVWSDKRISAVLSIELSVDVLLGLNYKRLWMILRFAFTLLRADFIFWRTAIIVFRHFCNIFRFQYVYIMTKSFQNLRKTTEIPDWLSTEVVCEAIRTTYIEDPLAWRFLEVILSIRVFNKLLNNDRVRVSSRIGQEDSILISKPISCQQ